MIKVTSTRTVLGKFNIRSKYGIVNIDQESARIAGLFTDGLLATEISEGLLKKLYEVGRIIDQDALDRAHARIAKRKKEKYESGVYELVI